MLVTDMVSIVDDFATSLAARNQSLNSSNDGQRLKMIEEHWQENSKRGRGRYTKPPDDKALLRMKCNLLTTSIKNINDGLCLPVLNPKWLDIAIGLLLSIESVRNGSHSLSEKPRSSRLLQEVENFIQQYLTLIERIPATNRQKCRSLMDNLAINIPVSITVSDEPDQQIFFILESLISPIVNSNLEMIKTFICVKCNESIRTYFSTSFPILLHPSQGTFSLEREIINFFAKNLSDRVCSSCKMPMLRQISVMRWPDTFLISIDRSGKTSAHSQKAPDSINLDQFNEQINIGIPGMSVFDLTCFLAIKNSNNISNLVRVTKIKSKWLSSITGKMIGEGEQFRNLYGNSSKLFGFLFLFINVEHTPIIGKHNG